MSKMIVVDPHDWIDPSGAFPESGPVRMRAIRVAQCIEYGGPLRHSEGRATLIPCRFRPEGVGCVGFLLVIKQPDDTILAMCDTCREEEFLIHHWHGMPWAAGPHPAVHLDETVAMDEDPPTPPEPYEPDEIDTKLTAALKRMHWDITSQEFRELLSTSRTPMDVFQHLQRRLPPPPSAKAVQDFVPVLMEAWNHTARPELDGLTPHEKANENAPIHRQGPSRKGLCPCGSGKKFKRCCISKGGNN
ncbi:MAG: SEC-C metal-binding domain-containing protein [Deltaproteobacteria bacterium]|nr:SEC-C metal-binding domain-containing protein [Deltaproteobacteria bacterium]